MFKSILHRSISLSIRKRGFRMSAKLRSEQVIEEMKAKNPYFEKYAAKLAAAQQQSPEEFLSKLDKVEKEKSKPKFGAAPSTRDYSELLQPKGAPKIEADKNVHRKLEDIMKLDLVEDKTIEEITAIWIEYHKNKDVIVATIPIEHFDRMTERSKQFPTFIFPIPRSQGYEFIMLQFYANTVHFTPLLCYQVHKENAPECLNMTHYTEFRERGIVLMRGEFDPKILSTQEAQCLANQLQLYYSQSHESKLKLLETFTKKPESFKHMDVIGELANLKI